ncbi:MAG TPA: hypothetical protein HA254_00140 [Candidatus Diapherotrites archaeon]|uniref:Uncharacterized protein n=1 Tax=Candidatus Iainarchaeum sp. TaxID=3101447 RepID=A0A7J4IXS5_9ARCH|nr:hypothetical protein [Candidatus Diapherotrites archaeon]
MASKVLLQAAALAPVLLLFAAILPGIAAAEKVSSSASASVSVNADGTGTKMNISTSTSDGQGEQSSEIICENGECYVRGEGADKAVITKSPGSGNGTSISANVKNSIRSNEDGTSRDISINTVYTTAQNTVAVALSDFEQAKEKFKDASTGEKSRMRTELAGKAGIALASQIDAMILKLREAEESGGEAGFSGLISFLQSRKEQISGENVGEKALIDASTQLGGFWDANSMSVRRAMAMLVLDRFELFAAKAASFADRFDGQLAALKAEGKDTAELEAGVAKIRQDVERFRSERAGLLEKLNGPNSASTVTGVLAESKTAFKKIHGVFREDVRLMRLLVRGAEDLQESGEISSRIIADIRSITYADSNSSANVNTINLSGSGPEGNISQSGKAQGGVAGGY